MHAERQTEGCEQRSGLARVMAVATARSTMPRRRGIRAGSLSSRRQHGDNHAGDDHADGPPRISAMVASSPFATGRAHERLELPRDDADGDEREREQAEHAVEDDAEKRGPPFPPFASRIA